VIADQAVPEDGSLESGVSGLLVSGHCSPKNEPLNLQPSNPNTKIKDLHSPFALHPSAHRPIRLPNEHIRGHADKQAMIKHAGDLRNDRREFCGI